MAQKIIPIIMAGGKGTRLWPLSRATAPKQFIQFIGDKTLFQNTLERVTDGELYEAPIVITNEEFRFLVAEQARELVITLSAIILEPVARNTAAAVAAAAAVITRRFGEDAVMQILASDHEIVADQTYFDCIRTARDTALAGKLVTFGITPTEAATGYGYIETEPGTTASTACCTASRPAPASTSAPSSMSPATPAEASNQACRSAVTRRPRRR